MPDQTAGTGLNIGGMLGALQNWLSTGRIKLGDAELPIGGRTPQDRYTTAMQYRGFLNDLARGKYTSPLVQKQMDQYQRLTKAIARAMGASPETAEAASRNRWGSIYGLPAFAMMMQEGSHRQPQIYSEFMRNAGARSAHLGGGQQVQQLNNTLGSVANTLFEITSDYRNADELLGASSEDAALWLTDRYLQGDFRDVVTNPHARDASGSLTRQGQLAVKNRAKQLLETGFDLRYLFGGNLQQATNEATRMFGQDLLRATGLGTGANMLREMRYLADSTGVSPEEAKSVLQSLSSAYGGSGIHPAKLLTLAEEGIRFMAASRHGPTGDHRPIDFNIGTLNLIAQADQSEFAEAAKTAYGALARRRGKRVADRVMEDLLRNDPDDKLSPRDIIQFVNENWLTSTEKISSRTAPMYRNSEEAKQFDISGDIIPEVLRRGVGNVEDIRRKVLRKSGFGSEDLRNVQHFANRQGSLNRKALLQYFVSTGMPETQADLKASQLANRWDMQMRREGYPSEGVVERMQYASRKLPALRKEQRLAARADRMAGRKGIAAGFPGVMKSLLEGDTSFKELLKGFSGKQEITEEDIRRMHGDRTAEQVLKDLHKQDKQQKKQKAGILPNLAATGTPSI